MVAQKGHWVHEFTILRVHEFTSSRLHEDWARTHEFISSRVHEFMNELTSS